MATSEEFLAAYAVNRDADAFAALVRGHAGMVFSTCNRILGNAAEAEEVAQECFLELARNAGKVRGCVGGWLHGIATRKALHAARSNKRRRHHESRAERPAAAPADPTWAEMAPVVDEAIEELPDDLRVALLSYYFEERSQARIAREMGLSQPTVSRRVESAVELVRENLKKRGILVATVALAPFLQTSAAEAAPAALTTALTKMAVAGPTPAGGIMAATARNAGAIKMGFVAAGIAAVFGALAIVATSVLEPPRQPPTTPQPAVSQPPVPAVPAANQRPITERSLTGRVCLPDGTPVAGATVRLFYCHSSNGYGSRWLDETTADAKGEFVLEEPPFETPSVFCPMPVTRLFIVAQRSGAGLGFEPVYDARRRDYVVGLQPGRDVTITVRDQAAKPVAGAEVVLSTGYVVPKMAIEGPVLDFLGILVRDAVLQEIFKARTNAQGVVTIREVPHLPLMAQAIHPTAGSSYVRLEKANEHLTLALAPSLLPLRGKVTLGDTGQPAKGFLVMVQSAGGSWGVTDQDGAFTLPIDSTAMIPSARGPAGVSLQVMDPSSEPRYADAELSLPPPASDADVITVSMQPGRFVKGEAICKGTNTPVPNLVLWATTQQAEAGGIRQFNYMRISDKAGECRFCVVGEKLTVRVFPMGNPLGFGATALLAAIPPIAVPEGAEQFTMELPLVPETLMTVEVQDTAGKPLKEAQVMALDQGLSGGCTTDPLGRGTLAGLVEGARVMLYAMSGDGRLALSKTFEGWKGDESVKLQLKPALFGEIVLEDIEGKRMEGRVSVTLGNSPGGMTRMLWTTPDARKAPVGGLLPDMDYDVILPVFPGFRIGPLPEGVTATGSNGVKWRIPEGAREAKLTIKLQKH